MSPEQRFLGVNAAYVAEQWERYQRDPGSVASQLRDRFKRWERDPAAAPSPDGAGPAGADVGTEGLTGAVAASNLAEAIRAYGHLAAQLDPLGSPPPGDPSLDPEFHGLSEADLGRLPATLIGGDLAANAEHALEAIRGLRAVYGGRLGYDYDHIRVPQERRWLRQAAESGRFRPPAAPVDERQLLERLSQVEGFEQYLHRTFPGKIRFSIEGLDMLLPMLDAIVEATLQSDPEMVYLGMAHRGRLNVMAHLLGKPYAQILAEFRDPAINHALRDERGWTGDVKYHKGATREANGRLQLQLAPNPSHVEHVNPVVAGMARAAVSEAGERGEPRFDPSRALLILIHGDAAFPGEGVVSETLNLSRLPGYRSGGTIHLIANNQLGFTTSPEEARSTLYASDLAKGFKIPILHANADDPLACLEAARTAAAYRARFERDFLIDLIGYRRYGHNEGDEPSFTQPRMYQVISEHPSVRKQWAEQLIAEGQIEPDQPQELLQQQLDRLRSEMEQLKPEHELERSQVEEEPPPPAETGVPLERLREFNQALLQVPEGFDLHPKLDRFRQRRTAVLAEPDEASVTWAAAEELALASILADGTPVRLAGEDSARGTFSQRHAVWRDVTSGEPHTPLASLPQAQAGFEVINSPLTENAALAFEFGLNLEAPERLVIWEAQYGDFLNVAQAMLDEFVLAGRAKWGLEPSLVLLLPHGLEGQGPDHSSGRPERHLQLAANNNLRLAYPTTAAQYFHLLRSQAALLQVNPSPLIVLTPKGLLRHPLVSSTPRELAQGAAWQPVLAGPPANGDKQQVERLLLCTGRIFTELHEALADKGNSVQLARIEQLYPFPQEQVERLISDYPNLEDAVWVQEEPRNMGAWSYLRRCLQALTQERCALRLVARPRSSSPAEGSASAHAENQQWLVERAVRGEAEQISALEAN